MPNKMILFLFCALIASLSSFSQAKTKLQRDSISFAHLIVNTKEFKLEKHKMDSVFKASGKVAIAAFEIQMDEPDEKADKTEKDEKPAPKDPEDNFMTATIIEQQGVANVIMYELRYDRKKHQIVNVHAQSDGLDISVDSE